MADALDACDAEAVADQPRVPVQAVLDLRKFFPICADRGFGLINWW